MRARLLDAGAWALLALLLAGPMAGLRLQTEGTGLTLVTQWRPLAVIVVLVFVLLAIPRFWACYSPSPSSGRSSPAAAQSIWRRWR